MQLSRTSYARHSDTQRFAGKDKDVFAKCLWRLLGQMCHGGADVLSSRHPTNSRDSTR